MLFKSKLSAHELRKRPWRVSVFIEKINSGSKFEVFPDKQVILDKCNLDFFIKLKSSDLSKNSFINIFGSNSFKLKTIDEVSVGLTEFKKTSEFGGKGSGSSLTKQNKAKEELELLIKDAINQNNNNPITIKIENILYDEVIGIEEQEKIKGVDPKSDFNLIRKGKEKVYISHKDGITPKDFVQWGGTSWKAGKNIENHKEVLEFAKDLKETEYIRKETIGGIDYFTYNTKTTIGRKIEDMNLKLMSVFGNKYSKDGESGPENVDLVCQGIFTLKNISNGVYELSSSHMFQRKTFTEFDKDYDPVLVIRGSSGRMSHGILKGRMLIYPASGRKIAEFI